MIIQNIALNILGLVVPFLVMVAAVPPVVRALGEERYGYLALISSFLSFLTVLDLGLGRATTRYLAGLTGAGRGRQIRALLGTALSLSTGLGLAVTLALVLASPLLAAHALVSATVPESERVLLLYATAPAVLFTVWRSTLSGVLEAAQRFDLVNALRVPSLALTTLLPLLVVRAGGGLVACVAALVIKDAVLVALTGLVVARSLPPVAPDEPPPAPEVVASLTSFSRWLFVHNVASCVLIYAERFAVPALLSMTALTLYSIPYDLTGRFMVISGAVMAVLFPALSSAAAAHDRAELGRLFWPALKCLVLAAGFLSLALSLFAGEILALWLGPRFAESEAALQVLAGGLTLATLSWLESSVLQAAGLMKEVTVCVLWVVPVQLALTPLLVRSGGILGAALAANVHRVITIVAFGRLIARHGLAPGGGAWRAALAPAGAVALLSLAVVASRTAGSPALVATAARAALFAAGYAAVAWTLALGDDEKRPLRAALRRATGR